MFVAEGDGRIEEVKEGVDYGVRKRATSNAGKEEGEEKFLKVVSIYLKKHLYANAVTRNLWEGIQDASGTYG